MSSRSRSDSRRTTSMFSSACRCRIHVDVSEQRLHGRRRLEEAVVERLHQLVPLRSDEVEALLERLYIERHGGSSLVRRRLLAGECRTPHQRETRPATCRARARRDRSRARCRCSTASRDVVEELGVAEDDRAGEPAVVEHELAVAAGAVRADDDRSRFVAAASTAPIESRSMPGTFSRAGCAARRYAASPPTMFVAATCACSTAAGQSP